jgi:transcriptional regulator with XRE-family HTH domain
MESMAKVFGRRVKAYRNRRGLTQDELARIVRIDSKYIGSIERGEKGPSFDVAERLARALKVEYHELLLPDRLALGQMGQIVKQMTKELDTIDRRSFYVFFDDLLTAIRRLDRKIDTAESPKRK